MVVVVVVVVKIKTMKPRYAARCRAVSPRSFCTFTSAPLSETTETVGGWWWGCDGDNGSSVHDGEG